MYSLKMAVRELLTHCTCEKNLSIKTIKAYQTDLLQLESFLSRNNYGTNVTEITRNELREFLISLSALKSKSVKRKVASIKLLFNFLEFEDKVLQNPLRKMRIKIKEDTKLPKVMDIKEITGIFKAVYKCEYKNLQSCSYSCFESMRNIVVIELLFATGARVSEISGFMEQNINFDSGNITIKGKGNKERIIQICNKETISILKSYLKRYRERILLSGGYFLVNRYCKQLSDQSIRNLVINLASKAGITRGITPHIFRHSFATLLLERDVNIKYIQSLLGHSSIVTTQIYTHVNNEKQKQILRTKHPRKDFSMMV